MAKSKIYKSAPLPFMGQKRMFINEFEKVLKKLGNKTTFVDLFGGSGLLSHFVKAKRPEATVVYNDFDNYSERLRHIPETNALLASFRQIAAEYPRHKIVSPEIRMAILKRIAEAEREYGYVDYITISSSLLFSAKYVLSLEALKHESIYNNIRKNNYDATGYLDGLTIEHCDYKELFTQYKDALGAAFLIDPPYLNTEVGAYKIDWELADYLDVLKALKGATYVYFTSNKSSIVELCHWMGENPTIGNPFAGATQIEFKEHLNYNCGYTDIMLYKQAV